MRAKDSHLYILVMSQTCYYYTNPHYIILSNMRAKDSHPYILVMSQTCYYYTNPHYASRKGDLHLHKMVYNTNSRN